VSLRTFTIEERDSKEFCGLDCLDDPWWGLDGEFDPGSGQTLAAYLRHASRTGSPPSGGGRVANG
jgi:hypothetical protein